ncbi:type IV pilus assembly protein PilM [Candidatus Gottesmanbacteria bacterium]|nr:type IV pilus assembly protein PilM [Candidatus Gottesmanbacteria bacterium]
MQKLLVGLDIGTQTIKAVQMSREKNRNQLLAAGYIPTPTKVTSLNSKNSNNDQIMADSINRLVHDMKISTSDVSASLPSANVITRVLELPLMSDSELASSIQWEAEQYIPMPLSKVKLDFTVINRDEQTTKMKLLLIAAPIDLIEKYMHIITLAGLNPTALETEILAASRSITTSFPTLSQAMVISCGATTTEVALLHEQMLVYTKSIPLGGNTLTRAIAEELGFEFPQAEEYKKTYGLDEDKLEGKIAKSIAPYFTSLYSEIEKNIAYFKEQYPKDEITNLTICGGGAKLPGLVLAFTKNLGLDSQISNPFINLTIDPNILPSLSPDAPVYTQAIGLALKDVE